MTIEFMCSKTCNCCFNTIVHPNKRKLILRQYKTVANNGTSICINPKCIAIAAASRMLTSRIVAWFNNTSSYNTDQHTLLRRFSPQRYFDIKWRSFFFFEKVTLPKIQQLP
jgi:hypothetical protein